MAKEPTTPKFELVRPPHLPETPVPSIPVVDPSNSGLASVQLFAAPDRALDAPNRAVGAPHVAVGVPHRPVDAPHRPLDRAHRDVDAPHRHVVPAHAHERRPHADVGDPHLAVADQLRLHHLPGLREAARGRHARACRARRAISAWRWSLLGIVMLVVGIIYHVQFMLGLRHERDGDDARTA